MTSTEVNMQTASTENPPQDGSFFAAIDVDSLPDSGPSIEALAATTTTTMSKPCIGIQLTFPPGMSPYSSYPFMLHDTFSLPWDIHILSHRMWIQAISCKRSPSHDQEACWSCRHLLHNNMVEGILERIVKGVHENTPLAYQPMGGLIELVRRKNDSLEVLRLTKLTMARKLVVRARTLDAHKKFVMALGDSQVNRLDALIRAGLKGNMGIHGMIELLDRASKGVYKPHGYTEEETLRGLLFLRLGGSRVADLAHRSLGSPGESTLRSSTAVTPLSPSFGTPTNLEIRSNIRAAFKSSNIDRNYGYVLMIDELKTEERPRWDDKTNKILGLCREHSGHLGLEFCSIEVAKGILHDVLSGRAHWAKEVCLFYCSMAVMMLMIIANRPASFL